MRVPVMEATARELAAGGLVALRFDFRGVGRSEGSFGGAIGEMSDVGGAVQFLAERDEVDENRLYLMGYSFGAAVALHYMEQGSPISAVAALCLPLGESTIVPLDQDFWLGWHKPKIFLAGDRDHICPLSELRPLVGSLPEPKQLTVLEGADHFLWGSEQKVAGYIADYLTDLWHRAVSAVNRSVPE
jgi:alpha/beta superfamily hydrolase